MLVRQMSCLLHDQVGRCMLASPALEAFCAVDFGQPVAARGCMVAAMLTAMSRPSFVLLRRARLQTKVVSKAVEVVGHVVSV